MALSQPIQDYLEALGGSIGEQGIAGRRFQPAPATFAASTLAGIGRGIEMRRSLETARALRQKQADFEAKTGIPYELFSKLGTEAQMQILQQAGTIKGPEAGSASDIYEHGMPAATETGLGTGAFEGLSGQVETAPRIPPGLKSPELYKAFQQRYGVEQPPSPLQEAQIGYYGARRAESEARTSNLAKGLTAQGGKPGGRGRSDTENEIAAKQLAKTQGGDWQDWLLRIKSGEFRIVRTGATSAQVFDEKTGQLITTYNYGYGRIAPQASHNQGGGQANARPSLDQIFPR